MLGFPKADRTTIDSFNSNYLKTIVFQIKFANNEKVFEKKESYLGLFKELFPRITDSQQNGFAISINKDQTPILQPIPSEKNGVELRSEDGQKILAILKDGVTYTVTGSVYKNFDAINSELTLIQKALEILEIKILERIAIRKINIIDYEIPSTMKDTDTVGVMELLLHPELLNNMNYFPSKGNIVQSIHNVLFAKDDVTLNLKYGVIQPNVAEKKGQVLVDIDLFKQGKIESKSTCSLMKEINEEIFNVFNWSMKAESIKHLMEAK
jgi:uncharacterized protein (TIGR04255 family)